MKESADEQLASVANYLADQADIRLGIAFGSLITGRARVDSDLDLAILGDCTLDAPRRASLIEAIACLTGRPVDLVDLRNAGIPVARSAVLEGKVIFSRDEEAYPEQISRVLIDSADFLPYRDRLLRERRERWLR